MINGLSARAYPFGFSLRFTSFLLLTGWVFASIFTISATSPFPFGGIESFSFFSFF